MEHSVRWYALQTRPKHEDIVASLLRYKGYEEYVPEYSAVSKTRKRPIFRKLFPGYVFCRFNYWAPGGVGDGNGVVSTPGVVRVVGGRPPATVPEQELCAIRRALILNLKTEPCPYLEVGQGVTIERGPLRGTSGVVVSSAHEHRLVISIQLLQRSVAVSVQPEWVGMTTALGQKIKAAKYDAIVEQWESRGLEQLVEHPTRVLYRSSTFLFPPQ